MTPLDLDAIRGRADHYAFTRIAAAGEIGAYGWAAAAINSAEDVPALLAEVQRQRQLYADHRAVIEAQDAELRRLLALVAVMEAT